jgi:hypothetical protein
MPSHQAASGAPRKKRQLVSVSLQYKYKQETTTLLPLLQSMRLSYTIILSYNINGDYIIKKRKRQLPHTTRIYTVDYTE